MMRIRLHAILFVIFLIIVLASNKVESQSFFTSKNTSVAASFGLCKIQFYHEFTPVNIMAADEDVLSYSPSWDIQLQKDFYLNKIFDFSIGLSHLTLTEKSHNVPLPGWFGFSDKKLDQSFIHLTPTISVKLSEERFKGNVGIRMGTANFIGNPWARESSNAKFDLDYALEIGPQFRITKRFYFLASWIHGLTKYDHSIGQPVKSVSFYKYHSFQFSLKYILNEKTL